MTIIAAAIGPDGTWIGADGLTTMGDIIMSTDTAKWRVSPDERWAFAGPGSMSYAEVILHSGCDLWPTATGADGARELVANMRTILCNHPAFSPEQIEPGDNWSCYGWAPIIATDGHIWRVTSDLSSLVRAVRGVYLCAGGGSDVADGAMEAQLALGVTSARELVSNAVEAACARLTVCGGEISVRRIER